MSGLHELQARDLRRTLASWAQEVNVPMAVVQSQLVAPLSPQAPSLELYEISRRWHGFGDRINSKFKNLSYADSQVAETTRCKFGVMDRVLNRAVA